METTTQVEGTQVQQGISQIEDRFCELSDLQLAIVGGGIADVVL